jgi:Flp pilus assembly pilin Flp
MYERLTIAIGRIATFNPRELKREDGQGVTEYGLALAFVAIALGAVLAILHTRIATFIDTVGDDLAALPGTF